MAGSFSEDQRRAADYLLVTKYGFPAYMAVSCVVITTANGDLQNFVLPRIAQIPIERTAVSKPLTGIRVLDLSKVLAGPLCAQYLGDLGADIIKVETVGQGDETRGWPPFPAPGLGTVFLSANRNKRSIAVDMKSEKGREIVHALAKSADVAIESFGTGVAERLGIDAPTLRSLNDRLIHCSISGFGRSGPLKNSPGYDVILQAFCGVMSMTGDEDGGYIRSPISPIDQMTGVHAFSGILALLYAREKTGKGGEIQVSLFETALGCSATICRPSGNAACSRRNAAPAMIALSLSGLRGGRWPDHDRGRQRQSLAQVLRGHRTERDRRRYQVQDQC